VALDAAEPLDRIEEPRLATDGEIEPAVPVRHDVEPGGFLRVDDRGHRVHVLLAEHRVAERGLERLTAQAHLVPQGPRARPRDRRRQLLTARDP
jgi:hypothetical protein